MAYTEPRVPLLNILEADPATGLVLVGEITGALPNGSSFAGIFAKGCVLEKTDTGVDYFNSGTVAVPNFTVVTTGSAMTSLTGDVVAAGPGAAAAEVQGLFSVPLSAAATVDASFYVFDGSDFNPVVMAGDVEMADDGSTLINSINGEVPVSVSVIDEIYTSVGGNATESVALAGVLATDRVYATLGDDGPNNVTLKTAITSSGHVALTFSADPGSGAKINILVTRSTGL